MCEIKKEIIITEMESYEEGFQAVCPYCRETLDYPPGYVLHFAPRSGKLFVLCISGVSCHQKLYIPSEMAQKMSSERVARAKKEAFEKCRKKPAVEAVYSEEKESVIISCPWCGEHHEIPVKDGMYADHAYNHYVYCQKEENEACYRQVVIPEKVIRAVPSDKLLSEQ